MLHDSPLRLLHKEYAQAQAQRASLVPTADRPGAAVGHKVTAHVEYLPYGSDPSQTAPACEIVASFGEVELEYAAIRRSVALMDCPQRGTLLITGDANERQAFLNNMLTQELKDLTPGMAKQSFWLNRKGRIDGDLFVIELGDRMLISVDIHQAASVAQSLSAFIVMEDVKIEDASNQFHHLSLHGPGAPDALAHACGIAQDALSDQHSAVGAAIDGVEVFIARHDRTGEQGFDLIAAYDHTPRVWSVLLNGQSPTRVRPIGWHAFNIARIEAGTPLFNIDFGSSNLPHETGILHDRVSFTKGCYLGQEVVARMQNLGKPKQMLVGLRMNADLLPTADEQVFSRNEDGSMGDEIGLVTSSTLSPMLSAAPIAMAMLRTSHAAHGTSVLVNAEGDQATATVGPLRFWPIQPKPGGAA